MQTLKRPATRTGVIVLAAVLWLAPGLAGSEPADGVDATIRYLIGYVSASGLTFLRNDHQYSPLQAAEHMEKKYRHFRDDIMSPDDFIELCATRSLMSGEPYWVIDRNGNQIRTGDWLWNELAAYRVRDR